MAPRGAKAKKNTNVEEKYSYPKTLAYYNKLRVESSHPAKASGQLEHRYGAFHRRNESEPKNVDTSRSWLRRVIDKKLYGISEFIDFADREAELNNKIRSIQTETAKPKAEQGRVARFFSKIGGGLRRLFSAGKSRGRFSYEEGQFSAAEGQEAFAGMGNDAIFGSYNPFASLKDKDEELLNESEYALNEDARQDIMTDRSVVRDSILREMKNKAIRIHSLDSDIAEQEEQLSEQEGKVHDMKDKVGAEAAMRAFIPNAPRSDDTGIWSKKELANLGVTDPKSKATRQDVKNDVMLRNDNFYEKLTKKREWIRKSHIMDSHENFGRYAAFTNDIKSVKKNEKTEVYRGLNFYEVKGLLDEWEKLYFELEEKQGRGENGNEIQSRMDTIRRDIDSYLLGEQDYLRNLRVKKEMPPVPKPPENKPKEPGEEKAEEDMSYWGQIKKAQNKAKPVKFRENGALDIESMVFHEDSNDTNETQTMAVYNGFYDAMDAERDAENLNAKRNAAPSMMDPLHSAFLSGKDISYDFEYKISKNTEAMGNTGAAGRSFVRFTRQLKGRLLDEYTFDFVPSRSVKNPEDVTTGVVENPVPEEVRTGDEFTVKRNRVSKDKMFNAMSFIRGVIASGRSFSGFGYNDASFALDVAEATGTPIQVSVQKRKTDRKLRQRVETTDTVAQKNLSTNLDDYGDNYLSYLNS